ncbi:MAG: Gfo/Idh/MocA family protein [Terrimicrobiaceae bacterium]
MSIKTGLMGCGMVAGYGHIPAILETRDLQLLAVYDPNEESTREMRKRWNIPLAFSDETAFFKSGIEAVTITSPAPCHLANVLACARHRLPALCEKPLAMNAADGGVMISAMKKAGATLHAAFCYRFSPSALKIRELVRAGAIGDVRSLRLIYNWNVHGKFKREAGGTSVIQQRREDRMLEGGPMVDCGTHQIDLAVFWLGSKVVAYSGQGAWVENYEAPDHMWLHLDHANGAHTTVEISYSYHHTSRNARSEFVYELIGTKGVLRYDRAAQSFTMENDKGSHVFDFHPEKDFSGLYREWAGSLLQGGSGLLATAEEGLDVADIARKATEEVIRRRKIVPSADSLRR